MKVEERERLFALQVDFAFSGVKCLVAAARTRLARPSFFGRHVTESTRSDSILPHHCSSYKLIHALNISVDTGRRWS
jgi:hypothetical protein